MLATSPQRRYKRTDYKGAEGGEAWELRRLYRWSFAVRLSVGLVAWIFTIFFELPLMQDSLHYELMGARVAEEWMAGTSSMWLESMMRSGQEAWFIVATIAVFYYLSGGVRVVPLLLVFYSAITAWTPVLTYHIARQLGASPAAARIGARLVAFSPAFAFWAGALYKEGLILLLLNLCIYHSLVLKERWQWKSMATLGLCIPALFGLRFYLAILMSLVTCSGLLLGRARQAVAGAGLLTLMRQTVVVIAFVGALVVVGFTDRARGVMPTSVEAFLATVQISRDDLSRTAYSGYLQGADVSTPERAVQFLPVGLGYFLALPLPWHFGKLRQNLIIPETVFWLLLYPVIFIGMARGLRQNFQGSILLIAMMAAMSAFYALFSGNIGIVYRMRTQVWLLGAVFAGWGWERLRERRSRPVGFGSPAAPGR